MRNGSTMRVASKSAPTSLASAERALVSSSGVVDVGKRLSSVCFTRPSCMQMVPPTTVSSPKCSSAVLMPRFDPSVALVSLRTSSKNAFSSAVHTSFSRR